VDGDLVESFLDLDRYTMELVLREMNRDGAWDMDGADVPNAAGGGASGGTNGGQGAGSGGEKGGGGNGVVAGGGAGDSAADMDVTDTAHPELLVDDVMAMVEEMTMLH